jgi:hypothetical protein
MLRFSYLLAIRALFSAVPVALAAMMTAGSVASAQTCTALACQQVSCPVNQSTRLTGKVFAPNGVDPLPNVLVYVPGAPVTGGLDPLPDGVPNGPIRATNSPLVSTTTAVDGTFTLTNVPVGSSIPVVIQAGKWRRLFSIPSVAACANTSAGSLAFPSNHTQGDIPRIAVVTGSLDAVECAVSKIGIANSEFTNSLGSGRVHLFLGDGAAGSRIDANTELEHTLVSDQSKLNQYDVVMFPCQGQQFDKFAGDQQNVINYANAGGRVYATHFSYVWLYNDLPFSSTANWAVNSSPAPQDQTGFVNLATRNGLQLSQWLTVVGASSVLGQVPLNTLRRDVASVVPPSETWLSINDVNFGNTPMQFTFNTPVGADPSLQYGRVLFNDYHVENQNTAGTTFPNECSALGMTAQEKLLEYTIFNLSTFVAPEFPTLTVSVSHAPNSFKAGDTADQILINLTNTSTTQPAGASLTLTVSLPPGVTPVSIAGTNTSSGWSCSGVSCTRTQPLNPSTSDPVLVTVSVSSAVASGSITVSATAASGGLQNNATGTDQIPTVLLPTITWVTPAAIVYGSALGSAQLNAAANVPGAFNYTPGAGTVLSSGPHQLSVTFTPADSAHYAPVTASVLLQVNQATPVINWPTPSPITQGTALSLAQLNATANVPGTFLYTPPSGTVLAAGPQQLGVQFTPTDAINYKVVLAVVTLQVNPASNFSIKPLPPAETVPRGNLAGFILELDSINGFKGNVTLSCSGGPAGAVCADLPQTVKLNGRAYAISGILFPRSTQPGVYTITYKGVSGSLTNSTTATFTVKP